MKKILFFLHDYGLSGANRSFLDYISGVDKNSYDIEVVVPTKKTQMYEALNRLGVKCIIGHYHILTKKMYHTSVKQKIKTVLGFLNNGLVGYFSLLYLEKYIKKEHFDYIVSNSFSCVYGAILAKRTRVPHCFHIREFMETDHLITHYKRYHIERLTAYSKGICISNSIFSYYRSKYPFKDLKVIYNQIAANDFIQEHAFGAQEEITLLIAGILQKKKGQIDAIKATEYLNGKNEIRFKLYICGEGPDGGYLKKYCNEHNLKHVFFTGELSQEALLKLRQKTDIALICSESEALGRVTVEAMYCGNLVIGANGGETPALIGNTRGLMYTFGNPIDLAEKISYSISNTEASKEMIRQAREYAVATFSKPIANSVFEYLNN